MSIAHLLLVLVIVLVLFGPSKLEGIGSSLGRAIRGFKKGMEGDEESTASKATPPTATTETKDDPSIKS